MNKREVIADFTSLLDVIMIILFFFIMFGSLETQQTKEEYDAKMTQLREEQAKLDKEKDNLAQQISDFEKEKEEFENAHDRSPQNTYEIIDFNNNRNIRINLNRKKEEQEWYLDIYRDDELIASIKSGNEAEMAEQFAEAAEKTGYTPDKTMLCILTYDASEAGSNKAYKNTKRMLEIVQYKYDHLFCSEIDLSVY